MARDGASPRRVAGRLLAQDRLARPAPALPVCGQGKLFRGYFTMHERCACCGVGFSREHGQWVGSLDINTLLTAIILMAGAGFGPLWSLQTSLIVWCSAAVLVPIVLFRFTRGLWTAIVHLTGGVY